MIIERDSTTTLQPRVLEVLRQRQHREYYNAQWQLRKPIGVYNVSMRNVWESFKEVLDELNIVLNQERFRDPSSGLWERTLIRRQEDLISRLLRYFDDCFNMLCAFFPRTTTGRDLKALKKDQKTIGRDSRIQEAWSAVTEYRTHVANVMNHIKHHQGLLRCIVAFNDTTVIPGYFVEYVNANEVLTPHPDVHRTFRGQATAFSFYRDLRYKLWLVYAVGEQVADAVCQLEPTTTPYPDKPMDETYIFDIVSRIAALPSRVFRDEEGLDFPYVGVSEKDGVRKIYLEFPSKRTILVPLPENYRIRVAWVGDEVSNQFGLPYGIDPI